MFIVIACIFGLIGVCMKYKRKIDTMNRRNAICSQYGYSYHYDVDGNKIDNKTGIAYRTTLTSEYGMVTRDISNGKILRYNQLENNAEFARAGIALAKERGDTFAIVERDLSVGGYGNIKPVDSWGYSWKIAGNRYVDLKDRQIYVMREVDLCRFFVNLKTSEIVRDPRCNCQQDVFEHAENVLRYAVMNNKDTLASHYSGTLRSKDRVDVETIIERK